MNTIQTFSNPIFGELRTVIINGREYFFGIDIATDLMYKRPRKAIIDHCRGVLNQDGGVLTQDGEPIIPEGDVYRLIIKAGQQGNSKEIKEKADELERWIFDDILPTLRKTGSYGQPQLPQTTAEKIALLAQGHMELKAEIDNVREDLEAFKLELPLFPDDADVVKNALNKKVVEYLGGKDSNAYHDRGICQKMFSDAYRELKRNFGVGSYKSIKRNQKERALEVIEAYKPPVVLLDQIQILNSQNGVDV